MLGRADLIRMNQLVRRGIDLDGFLVWYRTLDAPEHRALATRLFEFAGEAGYGAEDLRQAIERAGLRPEDPVARRVAVDWADPRTDFPRYLERRAWLDALGDADREPAFRIAACLFGIAEGRVYRSESKASCNHWWHRDLLDERVVRAILADPNYHRTSRKDDSP